MYIDMLNILYIGTALISAVFLLLNMFKFYSLYDIMLRLNLI